ncbi:(R)-citramalate synthase [bacterium HR19]|nr:(R)-citramalate synthase [bacterium HR19]
MEERERKNIFEVISVDIDWEMNYENLVFGCKAKVKVRVGNKIKLSYATSKDGQIHAFDLALRNALYEFYPEVQRIKLVDYKVEMTDREKGTASYVRVKINVEYDSKTLQVESIGADLVAATIEALSTAYQTAIYNIISESQTILV